MAVAMYRMPAQMSLVDREEVSEPKSPLSMHATLKPRAAPSSAQPAPVAPPPTIKTSYGVCWEVCNRLTCSAREGKPSGPGTSLGLETTQVHSKPESRGLVDRCFEKILLLETRRTLGERPSAPQTRIVVIDKVEDGKLPNWGMHTR